ncbi:unnamed protein product [Paramecium octaurelia]|uniref:Uncharacterized protein n=1 Tax=Paramecium octaurelia TaxID=43137 RepID=A0A8S1YP67_PAROT|nr:unnamed protein product [Paramecium octaurelia]
MQNIAQQSNQEKGTNQKFRRCKQYKDWQKQKKLLEKQRQMIKKVQEKLEKQNQQLESPESDEKKIFEPCLFYTLMCTGMNGKDFEFLALTDLKLDLIKEAITEQNK